MKEILDEESKNALINYRIQRAYETLKEAQVMMRESFYNAAVNRLYYACYYAAVSLLLKYDHQPQTHNGVKTMLGLYNPQIQKSGETKTKGSKSGKNRGKSQFQAVIEI